MNSVVKQKYFIFLERHNSVCCQSFLINVDTVEQLWLECSQDQIVQN